MRLSLFGLLVGTACVSDAPITAMDAAMTDTSTGMDAGADSMQVVDTGVPDTNMMMMDTGADAGTCITGTLAWWRGEDNTADEMGMTPLSSYLNSRFSNSGRVNHAFDFDGVNMFHMDSTSAVQWGGGSAFSVTGWVNITQSGVIIHHNQANLVRLRVAIVDVMNAPFLHVTMPNFDMDVNGQKFAKGLWTFFALSCSGTTLTSQIDNFAPQTVSVPGCAPLGNGPVRVGRDISATDEYHGLLDELAVYNRALSAMELSRIYNNEVAGVKQCRAK